MQTRCAGCSKVEPKNFDPPQTPSAGALDGQNLISWRWSLPLPTNPLWWESMHAVSTYRGNRPTTHTNTATDRTDYNTLHAPQRIKTRCALEDSDVYSWKAGLYSGRQQFLFRPDVVSVAVSDWNYHWMRTADRLQRSAVVTTTWTIRLRLDAVRLQFDAILRPFDVEWPSNGRRIEVKRVTLPCHCCAGIFLSQQHYCCWIISDYSRSLHTGPRIDLATAGAR